MDLDALVTALTSAISTTTMLTNVTSFVPFIGGIAIFAFTYRLLSRVIKGASRGHVSM